MAYCCCFFEGWLWGFLEGCFFLFFGGWMDGWELMFCGFFVVGVFSFLRWNIERELFFYFSIETLFLFFWLFFLFDLLANGGVWSFFLFGGVLCLGLRRFSELGFGEFGEFGLGMRRWGVWVVVWGLIGFNKYMWSGLFGTDLLDGSRWILFFSTLLHIPRFER